MNLPRLNYYTVAELAEYWKVKKELVQRYIEMGQLVRTKLGNDDGEFDEDYILLEDAERFEKQEEVKRFEKEHVQVPVDLSLEQILNPDHPWHSENLALAVRAWLELYAHREGDKKDNSCKPSGGNTKLIRDWLKSNAENMGPTTEEHFRVIINPSKQGGPQKIS